MTVDHSKNILIVRTDRIGDVVLSLPMIPVLRSTFPEASLSFLLRSYTRELVVGQDLDHVLLYDHEQGEKPFRTMLRELRKAAFDSVVVTYPTFRLAALMFLARIPIRIGTGYRWYSFLFNRKVFEHRKTAEKHEAEYNLSLLRQLGCKVPDRPVPKLTVDPDAVAAARAIRQSMGLTEEAKVAILHPGSGGSARDWKPENFGRLALLLNQQGISVVVTGGPGEGALVDLVQSASQGTALTPTRTLGLVELAAFISTAEVFVANSTGPLHIAAAVGTPVVAFYPPITQCSSRRWGPLTEKRTIFEPASTDCPRCKGGPCQGNDCLDLITPEQAASAVEELIKGKTRKTAFA